MTPGARRGETDEVPGVLPSSVRLVYCFVVHYLLFDTADWSHRGDYIAKHGVTPAEADEAIGDPARVVLNPDPASKSGRGARIIGYSITARAVLTVIVLDDEGVTAGVNAWTANQKTSDATRVRRHHERKKKAATKNDLATVLAEESEAIDADRDAPITEATTVTRGHGRSKTLQIRLNPEELEELEHVAASRGLPTSTVAREAIVHLIRPAAARSSAARRLVDDFARYLDTLERKTTNALRK
jgi:hypothetical protein